MWLSPTEHAAAVVTVRTAQRCVAIVQGVTTVLYPLSVVKTQQMAIADAPRGLRVRRQWLQEACLGAPAQQ